MGTTEQVGLLHLLSKLPPGAVKQCPLSCEGSVPDVAQGQRLSILTQRRAVQTPTGPRKLFTPSQAPANASLTSIYQHGIGGGGQRRSWTTGPEGGGNSFSILWGGTQWEAT